MPPNPPGANRAQRRALVDHLERSRLTAGMDDLGPTPLGELRRRGLAVERCEAVSRATL